MAKQKENITAEGRGNAFIDAETKRRNGAEPPKGKELEQLRDGLQRAMEGKKKMEEKAYREAEARKAAEDKLEKLKREMADAEKQQPPDLVETLEMNEQLRKKLHEKNQENEKTINHLKTLEAKVSMMQDVIEQQKREQTEMQKELQRFRESSKNVGRPENETQIHLELEKTIQALDEEKSRTQRLQEEMEKLKSRVDGRQNENATSLDAIKEILEDLLDKKLAERLRLPQRTMGDYDSEMETPIREEDPFIFPRRRRRKGANIAGNKSVESYPASEHSKRKMTYSEAAKNQKTAPKGRASATQTAQQDNPQQVNRQPRLEGPRTTKVLFLPKEGEKVLKTLRTNKIRAREVGVRNSIEFPSGAALLMVEEGKVEETTKKLEAVGLTKKAPMGAARRKAFRVHDVPLEADEAFVLEDIATALQAQPTRVVSVPYKSQAKKDVKMIVVEGDEALMERAMKVNSIYIEYKRCRVDTTVIPMRCKKCNTLGHTLKNCKGIPSTLLVEHKKTNACLDCLMYNSKMSSAGFPKTRWRWTNHEIDSSTCPSKRAHIKKLNGGG